MKKSKIKNVKEINFNTQIMGVPYKTRIQKTGNYFRVFNHKGEIIETEKANKRTIQQAKKKFQEDKTLKKGVQRLGKNTFREFSINKPNSKEYQCVCKLTIKDKKRKTKQVFYGSSSKLAFATKGQAQQDAKRNAYARYFGDRKKIKTSDTSLNAEEIKNKYSKKTFDEQYVYERYTVKKNRKWFYDVKNEY